MAKFNGFFAATLETLGGFLVVLALVAAMNGGAKAQLPPIGTCPDADKQALCNVDCIGKKQTDTTLCESYACNGNGNAACTSCYCRKLPGAAVKDCGCGP